jgi:hypothetical protein
VNALRGRSQCGADAPRSQVICCAGGIVRAVSRHPVAGAGSGGAGVDVGSTFEGSRVTAGSRTTDVAVSLSASRSAAARSAGCSTRRPWQPMARACRRWCSRSMRYAALFDDAGITRVPALDRRRIAAAMVRTMTAGIGDGLSTRQDGVISRGSCTAACIRRCARARGARGRPACGRGPRPRRGPGCRAPPARTPARSRAGRRRRSRTAAGA